MMSGYLLKGWIVAAAMLGCIAVTLAAAGSHATQDIRAQQLIEKASYFQLFHVVALLFLASLQGYWFRAARWFFITGILLFCGSLYSKAIFNLLHVPLAPVGGGSFILGWLTISIGALRSSAYPSSGK